MINIWQYTVNFSTLQKIPDVTLLTEHIKQLRPAFLYGTNDITPLLSYLTGVPMLDNITDTNNNLYRKGLLNATELTQKAVASDTLLIGHGVNYPLYNVRQQLVDEIFDQKVVSKTCTITGGFPVRMEGIMNEINIARCY